GPGPRGREHARPPRSRLVRVLRPARQPGGGRRGIRRAFGQQLAGRADRPPHPRNLLRAAGRPAPAAADGAARGASRACRTGAFPGGHAPDRSGGRVRALMFERRLYFHIDWLLIAAVFALCAIGLAMIYSTTGGLTRVYWTQVYAVGLGTLAMAVCLAVDYRSPAAKSHWIYLAMIIALVGVLFFGAVRGGSRRWIDLGAFNLQPSEFAKAVLALMLAKMMGETRRPALGNQDLILAAVITAVPVLLISRQPDLGTAVTLLPVLLAIAYVAGMPMKYLGVLALVAVLAAPVAYRWGLEDYQRERISTFLDPEQD